tara:strand:+ start:3696 stop:4418 length:723 start_codon:yes stop_codon:yes gene_type:complete
MKSEKPVSTDVQGPMNGKKYTHPAFGMASVSRTNSATGPVNLFGSAIKHSSTISFKVHTAYSQRTLSKDWHFEDCLLLEFNMSQSQWTTLISSVNSNSVPITLNYRAAEGASLMECPQIETDMSLQQSLKEEVRQAVEQRIKDVEELTALSSQLLSSGRASKVQLSDLHKKLVSFSEGLPNTMAFIQGQSEKAIDETVANGKAELEAFTDDLAFRKGVDVLKHSAIASEIIPSLSVYKEV